MSNPDIMDGFRFHGDRTYESVAPFFYAPIFDCTGDQIGVAGLLWHPYDKDGSKLLKDLAHSFWQRAHDARKYSIAHICPDEKEIRADKIISSAVFSCRYAGRPEQSADSQEHQLRQDAAEICLTIARRLIEDFIPMLKADHLEKRYSFLDSHIEFLIKAWKQIIGAATQLSGKNLTGFLGDFDQAVFLAKRRTLCVQCQGLAAMQAQILTPGNGPGDGEGKTELSAEAVAEFLLKTGAGQESGFALESSPTLYRWKTMAEDFKISAANRAQELCNKIQSVGEIRKAIEEALGAIEIRCGDATRYESEQAPLLAGATLVALIVWLERFTKMEFEA